jgi:hypothetical protein
MSGCCRAENWKPFEEKVLVEIMVNHTNNSIQNLDVKPEKIIKFIINIFILI